MYLMHFNPFQTRLPEGTLPPPPPPPPPSILYNCHLKRYHNFNCLKVQETCFLQCCSAAWIHARGYKCTRQGCVTYMYSCMTWLIWYSLCFVGEWLFQVGLEAGVIPWFQVCCLDLLTQCLKLSLVDTCNIIWLSSLF